MPLGSLRDGSPSPEAACKRVARSLAPMLRLAYATLHTRTGKLLLAFQSASLRRVCESERHAKDKLGEAVAETLKRRLADMVAAKSVSDLVAGRAREIAGNPTKEMAVDLCNNYRIVFTANHTKSPVTETGRLDWKHVSRIKILRIERDHG